MVWDECVGVVVGEGVVLTSDVWFVEECDGTVVGEGVVLICDVWLVGECGGTVVGEGVVLICVPVEESGGTVVGEGVVLVCGVWLAFLGLLFFVRLDFVGRPACSHICRLGIVGIGSLVLEH